MHASGLWCVCTFLRVFACLLELSGVLRALLFAVFRLRVAYRFSVWHMFFVPDILCVVSTCVVDHLRERERERESER